jgi:hypothetical protein
MRAAPLAASVAQVGREIEARRHVADDACAARAISAPMEASRSMRACSAPLYPRSAASNRPVGRGDTQAPSAPCLCRRPEAEQTQLRVCGGGMPASHGRLTDKQIDTVATYRGVVADPNAATSDGRGP